MKKTDLPTTTTFCFICGRELVPRNATHVLEYLPEGGKEKRDACRQCARRLAHEGVAMIWHHDDPKVVGPCPPEPR